MNVALIYTENDLQNALADDAQAVFSDDFLVEIVEDLYRPDAQAAKLKMAMMRQARIRAASDHLHYHAIEGVGTPMHRTETEVYHQWARRFGRENGDDIPDYSCWNDDQFVREWLRDNPEVRVPVEKNGNRVGWTPAVEKSPAAKTAPPAPAARKQVVLTDSRGNV